MGVVQGNQQNYQCGQRSQVALGLVFIFCGEILVWVLGASLGPVMSIIGGIIGAVAGVMTVAAVRAVAQRTNGNKTKV